MFNFRPGAGAVVAADSKNAVAAVDDALLNSVRMYASIIEATTRSDLPANQSQKLLASMTESLNSVVKGRGEMVATIRHLAAIKAQSNFAPDNYGCPEGWDVLAGAAPAGEKRQIAKLEPTRA
ncbi:hypothetical protein [Sphingosinicella sp. BN140058]|uniref:hypothetical protein n=1 Tax=Sphingosinicella sp. BN140058 TaxID=1892855 RepID=UPI001011BA50|nr:hypothetical protein [Sphingosinicella sp. BN140058]QAY79048.1 hypothetical protein ETR14_22785 [Sphingosinicella sp. BN140058]